MDLRLQCYARGSGDRWEAICVDLDISVQGRSPADAKSSLATAIEMYLQRVAELPADERRAFLARRSPWHVRLRLAVSEWLHRRRHDGNRPEGFVLHPQVPAHS